MEQSQPAQVSKVKSYGKMGSSIGYMIRDFPDRSDVPFEWIELADDEDARRLAGVTSLHDSRLPVCVFPDGARVECPTVRQITEKLAGSTIRAAPSTIWRSMPGDPRG